MALRARENELGVACFGAVVVLWRLRTVRRRRISLRLHLTRLAASTANTLR